MFLGCAQLKLSLAIKRDETFVGNGQPLHSTVTRALQLYKVYGAQGLKRSSQYTANEMAKKIGIFLKAHKVRILILECYPFHFIV